jgi:hypothetical protein
MYAQYDNGVMVPTSRSGHVLLATVDQLQLT